MIKCPNCGAELNFSAEEQLITCEYCKSKFNPNELNEKVKKSEEIEDSYEGKSYLCSQCGAKLLTFDETAITFCSYCGSQAMIESKMIKQNNPDYVIPFSVTKDDCIKAYKKVVSKSLFAPNYMKSDIVVNKFRGIYMPYAIYKVSHHGNSLNKGSKYKYRRGDYVYYDDYEISADVDADYNGISYDLASKFYDKFSYALPHNFKGIKDFNANYLSGFYADALDVDSSLYRKDVERLAEGDSTNHMPKREFSRYGCVRPRVNFSVSDTKVGMFPVYFLAIRDKKEKYVNYAVINGQTGKAVVDLPIDFKKYILISLLLAIPLFLLINNFLVITPKKICIFSIIASIISLIISSYQSNKVFLRENHLDDFGYLGDTRNNKIKKKGIFKKKIKQILAIILGIAVLVLNFVNDIYYYGACIIMLVLVILSFYDLVRQHNLLVSTKLPQLEKRGGDERD